MVPTGYIIKRAIILIVILNTIYLSTNLLFFDDGFSIKDAIYNLNNFQLIYIENESQEPTLSFTRELKKLFAKVEKNEDDRFWLKNTELTHSEITIDPKLFLVNSEDENAWINKNTLFYDIRMTLALYVNYIKAQTLAHKAEGKNANDISVPFHWVDWIDLTYMNDNELSKPLNERRTCDWLKPNLEKGRKMSAEILQCDNNDQITASMLRDYGFDSQDQLPGYIMRGFCRPRGTIDARLAQANSYRMTNMPLPFRLIFLNKNNGTYEVNVDQGKKRILKSNLVQTYIDNNNLAKANGQLPKTLSLDPVKEFKALKKVVSPKILSKDQDIYGLYGATHSTDITTSKNLHLPKQAFQYNDEDIELGLKRLENLVESRELTLAERSFAESLILSKERDTDHEHVFFRQATLWPNSHKDKANTDKDPGYHYDWRFFTGTLFGKREGWNEEELMLRQEVILDRLSRSWFRFAEEKGIISWIMHGPLLSWYWNGLMFPFDDDLDIQMPARELVRVGELYNQTLVIEDLEEGFGKFLVDIGTYVHNRDISKRENHIDARFIDIDSGIYIDITGLGVSDAKIPEEFENDKELVQISEETRNELVYNDRRKHWYKHEQLSPLKYTQLGGVPMYMPNDISNRLIFEYPEGMTKPNYKSWFYIPQLSLWVHKDKLTKVFDANDFLKMSTNVKENSKVDDDRLFDLILDMQEEQVVKLLNHDDDILCEYYKVKHIADIHSVEREYLFEVKEKLSFDEADPEYRRLTVSDRVLEGDDLEHYNEFVHSKIKMTKPLRKSLFQYEKIEQPLHHKEPEE